MYDAAQLDAETLIVALVYIERVLSFARSSLGPSTWRPVTCIAMILAAKVWNDLAVWNVDFAAAVPGADTIVLNRLEVRMLESLRCVKPRGREREREELRKREVSTTSSYLIFFIIVCTWHLPLFF
jgi:hypothetical protein